MSDASELEARLREEAAKRSGMSCRTEEQFDLKETLIGAADALADMRAEIEKVQHLLRRCVVAFSEMEPKSEDYDAINEAALYLKSLNPPIPAAPKE